MHRKDNDATLAELEVLFWATKPSHDTFALSKRFRDAGGKMTPAMSEKLKKATKGGAEKQFPPAKGRGTRSRSNPDTSLLKGNSKVHRSRATPAGRNSQMKPLTTQSGALLERVWLQWLKEMGKYGVAFLKEDGHACVNFIKGRRQLWDDLEQAAEARDERAYQKANGRGQQSKEQEVQNGWWPTMETVGKAAGVPLLQAGIKWVFGV